MMHPYLNPNFMWLLAWSLVYSSPQCTRCGGYHAVSKCPWPTLTTKGAMDD
jgi:hypothetical protein